MEIILLRTQNVLASGWTENNMEPMTGDRYSLEFGNIIEVLGHCTIVGHKEWEDGSLVPICAYPCKLIVGSAFGKEEVEYHVYCFETLNELRKIENFQSNYYRCLSGSMFGEVRLFDEAPVNSNEWELVNVTSFEK